MKTTKTIPNKAFIMDYLQISSEKYDEDLFQRYWDWCTKYGKTPNNIQQLLSNSSVSKWWATQNAKNENQFINAYSVLPKRNDILEHQYYGFIVQIFAIYPKPLIDAIMKDNMKIEVKYIKNNPLFYAN